MPTAFLRRHFRMDRIFVADMANTCSSGILVITLAVGRLGSDGPGLVLGGWASCWAPCSCSPIGRVASDPDGDRDQVRRLLAFGLPLAGANIIAFSVLNVDYVVVGRVLGATALGLYVLAFNISGWPMNVFGAVVRSISLPGFAHLQRDGEDMPGRVHREPSAWWPPSPFRSASS